MADLETGVDACNRGDCATAMRKWRPLAEAGNAKAQINLGDMCAKGDGATEDLVLAYAWYNIVATQDHEKVSHTKEVTRRKMTTTQIAEAQSRAVREDSELR